MKKNKKFILLIGVITVLLIFALGYFKYAAYDNPSVLCKIAKNFDDPSVPFYLFLERIYSISENKNVTKLILLNCKNEEECIYNDCYARVLGVIGKREALNYLIRNYDALKDDENYEKPLHNIILSIGLIGDKSVLPFLEEKLKQKNQKVMIAKSIIASALYLIGIGLSTEAIPFCPIILAITRCSSILA